MRIFPILSFLIFIWKLQVHAQDLEKLKHSYDAFISDPQLKHATSSLTVMQGETGKVIFSKNSAIGLVPASTLKIVTSATAYYCLGSGFTYATALGYTGKIHKCILEGDLFINGTGDPTLGSNRYPEASGEKIIADWLAAIQQAGIKKIKGRIIGNDSLFGTQIVPRGWIWEDLGSYYGAGASALNWRENEFKLSFKPGNALGDDVSLTGTNPKLPYLKLVNEVKTGEPGSGDHVFPYIAPYNNVGYLRGTYAIDLRKEIAAAVPDPAFEAACQLANALRSHGITLTDEPTTTRILDLEYTPYAKKPHTILSIHVSPTLHDIVYEMNQKSINLYAECLLKSISLQAHQQGHTAAGIHALKTFWHNRGLDTLAMHMVDGSGLSPENRITSFALASILQKVSFEPWFNSYLESFPKHQHWIIKSGSIHGVLAYAGYCYTVSGTPLTFAFMVNNYNGSATRLKDKIFKVLETLQ